MQVIYTNGRIERMSSRELRGVLFHILTLVFFGLGMFVFRLLPVADDLPPLPPRLEMLFWGHLFVVYAAVFLGVAHLCERLGRAFVTPLVQGLCAVALCASAVVFHALTGSVARYPVDLLILWLLLWMLLTAAEVGFMATVFDRVRAQTARPQDIGQVQLVFLTGRSVRATPAQARDLMLHPLTVAATLAALIVLILFVEDPEFRGVPIQIAVAVRVQALAVFYAVLLGAIWLCARTGLRCFIPLVLLTTVVVARQTSGLLLAWLTDRPLALRLEAADLLFYWAILSLFEFVAVVFALDRVLRDVMPGPAAPPAAEAAPDLPPDLAPEADPASDAPPAPAALILQGVVIAAAQIATITAEEHYLRVVTPERSRLLRGRMADVEAQLPAALGLRVHRSHWVAGWMVAGLRRSDAGWTLLLTDGSEVPVARGRQSAVRAWLRELGHERRLAG